LTLAAGLPQAFARAEAMQKVALEALAFSLPAGTLDELRTLFNAIDADHSGTISCEHAARTVACRRPCVASVHRRMPLQVRGVSFATKCRYRYDEFERALMRFSNMSREQVRPRARRACGSSLLARVRPSGRSAPCE